MRRNSLTQKIGACSVMLRGIVPITVTGRVVSVSGFGRRGRRPRGQVFVGDQLLLNGRDGASMRAEVAGFRDGLAQALPSSHLHGLGPGLTASLLPRTSGSLAVSDSWLGRVVDPLGRAMDGKGPMAIGSALRPIAAAPPEATIRARLGDRIALVACAPWTFSPPAVWASD